MRPYSAHFRPILKEVSSEPRLASMRFSTNASVCSMICFLAQNGRGRRGRRHHFHLLRPREGRPACKSPASWLPNIASRTAYYIGNVSEQSRFALRLPAGRVTSEPIKTCAGPVCRRGGAVPHQRESPRPHPLWIPSASKRLLRATGNKHLKVLPLPAR